MFAIINPNVIAKQLFADLDKIKEWAFQWKISFNTEVSEQAQGVIFTEKVKVVHPSIFFNNKPIQQVSSQKHLGLILDISIFDIRYYEIF